MTAPDGAAVAPSPPSRRLPALLPAGLVVLSLTTAGAWHGYGATARDCARTAVDITHVAVQNGLLNALLMTGLFTMGLSTLLLGGVVLATTGASVGGLLGAYGWQGAALLAPHGVLELTSWVLAASVGLHPLTRRLTGPEAALGGLARKAGVVLLLVLVAAPLERLWTSYYGNNITC